MMAQKGRKRKLIKTETIMIIKVEAYYELSKEGESKFPEHSKAILESKVTEFLPNDVIIKGDWWNGAEVTAHRLTVAELHERIRTAK
jgi:hypothetical protein